MDGWMKCEGDDCLYWAFESEGFAFFTDGRRKGMKEGVLRGFSMVRYMRVHFIFSFFFSGTVS